MQNRRHFMETVLMGAAGGVLSMPHLACAENATQPAVGDAMRRPNVVIILTDDQDRAEVGCYGGKVLTPHMDSLARDGVKFQRFYVCSAVCAPSRHNLLSGRWASRSKVMHQKYPPPGPINIGWEPNISMDASSLPKRMQAAGYATGMVGKWHQGAPAQPLIPVLPDADPTEPAVAKVIADNYQAIVANVKRCGFDYADGIYQGNNDTGQNVPAKLRVHNMEWVTQNALSFIDQNKDRPFFLYVAPTLVHSPDNLASLNADPRYTPAGILEKAPDCQPPREDVLNRVAKAKRAKSSVGNTWLDDGVGAILQKLDDLKLAENTLVWLISDNGNDNKFTSYDGAARVPSLARWKGVIPAGTVCDTLACNVDVAPTVLALCGGTPWAETPMDGQNIIKALKGDKTYQRQSIFLEITTERGVVSDDGYKYIAVRHLPEAKKEISAGKKLNHWCRPMDDHTYNADKMPGYFDLDQLYNLKKDPLERQNLAKDPAHSAKLKELQALLKEYCAKLPHTYGEFKTTEQAGIGGATIFGMADVCSP